MSKKILKVGTFGILGGSKKKKKEAADTNGDAPNPIIAALSPEETRRRKLIRKPTLGASTSVLGTASTLGG